MNGDFVEGPTGRVERVLSARNPGLSTSEPVGEIELVPGEGIRRDKNSGVCRPLKPRREALLAGRLGLPAGTEMANVRQISIVAREELEAVRKAMGVVQIVDGNLGENIIVSGIADFTARMTPGTVLVFQRENTPPVVVFLWGRNPSCAAPGEAIQACNPDVAPERNFQQASHGLRGGVGFVVTHGLVRPGDTVTVWHPQ